MYVRKVHIVQINHKFIYAGVKSMLYKTHKSAECCKVEIVDGAWEADAVRHHDASWLFEVLLCNHRMHRICHGSWVFTS